MKKDQKHFKIKKKMIVMFYYRDVPGAVLPENDNITNNNNSPTEENNHFYKNLPEPPPYKRYFHRKNIFNSNFLENYKHFLNFTKTPKKIVCFFFNFLGCSNFFQDFHVFL